MTQENRGIGFSVPFKLVEIFEYIIPGMVLVFGSLLFEYWINIRNFTNGIHLPLYTFFKLTYFKVFQIEIDNSWVIAIFALTVLLIFFYIIGHIITSIAIFLVDSILIRKGFKYPYEVLLQIDDSHSQKVDNYGQFYRGLFIWINILLVVSYMSIIQNLNNIIFNSIMISLLVLLFITLILKLLSTEFENRYKNIKDYKNPVYEKYFRSWMSPFLYKYFASPFKMFFNPLRSYLRINVTFEDEFIQKYDNNFKRKYGLNYKKMGTNNFWFCESFIAQKSPSIYKNIQNLEMQFTFARNIGIAFYLVFIYSIILISIQWGNLYSVGQLSLYHLKILIFIPIFYLLIGLALLIRKYSLYFSYYTKNVIRNFVILSELEN